ncbi:MAG: hypothetical protein FWD78_14035, partial [Treponema sp.]|nr:hypothetical protein [Treponema sp.]
MVERRSLGGLIFDISNITLLSLMTLVFAYPMLHVLMASFSNPIQLLTHIGPLIKPAGFSLEGYKIVLRNPNVLSGYKNTLIYITAGTAINILMTSLGAY